jgi:hypothetical protein
MRRALLVAFVAVLTLPAAAQASTFGAVGGLRNPAAGELQLTVQAVETDGIGLRSATAILGGNTTDTVTFAEPDCEPGVCPAVGTVNLVVPTGVVTDGPSRIEVTVEDAAGTVTHVLDETIIVANTPVVSTPTVTISVGGGSKKPQTGPPHGPGGPVHPGATGCRSPQLSMFLASRPLRVRHGVAVLKKGRRYKFAGRLTCLIDGHRKAAPRGTPIGIRDRFRGRTVVREATRVRADGRVAAKLAHRRSCTIVFRIRGAGGNLISVRIPIRVVRR